MILSKRRFFLGLLVWLLASMRLATPALAETEDEQAVALFEQGRKLARDGRCADAIPPLLESVRHAEGVGPLLNLGHCYETVGKTASAHRYFVRAQELASARDDRRRDEAGKRARALEVNLSVLVVHVPTALRSDETVVRIDGEHLPRDRWELPVPVDPGEHAIEVVAPQQAPQTGIVVVSAKRGRVEWTAKTPASTESPVVVVGPVPAPPRETSSTQRTIGLAVGGVGVAGVVAGTVFGLLSINGHSNVVDRCPSYPTCSSSDRATLDDLNASAITQGSVATIAITAGVVLLAGGAALFFTAPSRGASPRLGASF